MNSPAQGPSQPQIRTVRVTKAFASDLLNAAATSDSAVIWQQPANTILLFSEMVLDVAFVATGLTTMTITLGDGGNAAGLLTDGGQALRTDAVGTAYKTKGAYFDATAGSLLKETATNWTGYATAGVANLNTLTAGQVTFKFVYLASS